MKRIITLLLTLCVALGIASAVAQPAQATIGSYHWGYGTIYVQNVSPTAAWAPDIENRVLYYHNLGAHWNVIQGNCRVGYPCVRLSIGTYGQTGWLGLTTFPYLCGTDTWCNYGGNMNDTTRTMRVAINTSYDQDYAERRAVGCHEMGHALGYLQHEDGTTCMNAAYIPNGTPEFLTSADKQQIITRFSTIAMAPCAGCTPKPATKAGPASDRLSAATPVNYSNSAYDLTQAYTWSSSQGICIHPCTIPKVNFTSHVNTTMNTPQGMLHYWSPLTSGQYVVSPPFTPAVGQNVGVICWTTSANLGVVDKIDARFSSTVSGSNPPISGNYLVIGYEDDDYVNLTYNDRVNYVPHC